MPPDYSIMEMSSHTWLSVKSWTNEGSGASAFSGDLFEIQSDAVTHVLSYPKEAFQDAYLLGGPRYIRSEIISFASVDSMESLAIRFFLQLSDSTQKPVIAFEKTMVYRRSEAGEFHIDPQRSEISKDEFDGLFLPMDYSKFLRTYFEPLKNVAESYDVRKKRWLREVLSHTGQRSNEKTQLLELLND
jgi:hypothetical protein